MSEPIKVSFPHSAVSLTDEELATSDLVFAKYMQILYGGTSGMSSNFDPTKTINPENGNYIPLDMELDFNTKTTLESGATGTSITAASRQKAQRVMYAALAKFLPKVVLNQDPAVFTINSSYVNGVVVKQQSVGIVGQTGTALVEYDFSGISSGSGTSYVKINVDGSDKTEYVVRYINGQRAFYSLKWRVSVSPTSVIQVVFRNVSGVLTKDSIDIDTLKISNVL